MLTRTDKPFERELHFHPSQAGLQGAAGTCGPGRGGSWGRSEGARPRRAGSEGAPPPPSTRGLSLPLQSEQQFPKTFPAAGAGQVSRATGQGRGLGSARAPPALGSSPQPITRRLFPAHCCLLLTPQRSARRLAALRKGAEPPPPLRPPLSSIHKIPAFPGHVVGGVAGRGNDTTKAEVSQTTKLFFF